MNAEAKGKKKHHMSNSKENKDYEGVRTYIHS